jgi:hypothetical protein
VEGNQQTEYHERIRVSRAGHTGSPPSILRPDGRARTPAFRRPTIACCAGLRMNARPVGVRGRDSLQRRRLRDPPPVAIGAERESPTWLRPDCRQLIQNGIKGIPCRGRAFRHSCRLLEECRPLSCVMSRGGRSATARAGAYADRSRIRSCSLAAHSEACDQRPGIIRSTTS